MRTPVLIVGSGVALALVVLAGVELAGLTRNRAEAEDFEQTDPRDDPDAPKMLPGGVELDRRGKAPQPRKVEPAFHVGEGSPGDPNVSAEEARKSFATALAELDQILIDKKRLSEEEFRTINRWANDAFTGYSNHLDAREPGEKEQLEAAHRQLVERLGRLRKRVRKNRRGRQRITPTP